MKSLIGLLGWLLLSPLAFAQVLTIEGRVTDGVTGAPLPYVTIKCTPAAVGAITAFDGRYKVETDLSVDSITASYMGYEKVTKSVGLQKSQTIDFVLFEATGKIAEVVILPGGVNPADIIMRRAQKKKKEYNPEKIEHFEYEGYNKVQLAIDNVSDKFKKRKIFSAMEPLFDTVSAFTDSASLKVLPVFVSETFSDYYYRKFPRRTREIIKATKIQGVGVGDESYVSQVLGSTFQQYNFYENNLYILDKDFISPLSFQARSYYYFQLIDSVVVDDVMCYQIKVDPKNPKDLVFKGMIWITSEGYALKQLSLEITKDANLNFVEKLKIQQEFEEVEPTYWLPKKTRVLIDIAELTDNTVGMIGLYYNSARNIKVNRVRELPFFEEKVTVMDDAFKKPDVYWDTARHEKISAEDVKIYQMVDSLKNQPLVKTYIDIVEVIVEGHLPWGKLEIGPYQYLLGYNQLEGFRTRIGFRTSPKFHEDLMFQAYGAYGFNDKKIKYGASASYVFSRTKWSKLSLSIKDDVELIGLTDEEIGTSALFDAFATMGTNRLNRGFTYGATWEKEILKGYTQSFSLRHKEFRFEPVNGFNFGFYPSPSDSNYAISSNYALSTLKLRGRLSHKEQFVYRRNRRYSLGNLKAPVLSIDYSVGLKDVLGSDFSYQKLGLELWQFNSLGNLGTFEYTVKAYKAFGALPYPSLFILRGNETYFSNKMSYNLMNFFEFATDQYISLDYEHQFNGLIMNRVPVIKKLKWRSFANLRAVYGTMNAENKALMPINNLNYTNPSFMVGGKPYIEAGYGIENIFRFLRIDFIHRLTYLDPTDPSIQAFGIKANVVFRF